MDLFKKVKFILRNNTSKRSIIGLLFLLLISMIFEFLGLGIMVPILSLIVNSDVAVKYPELNEFLINHGKPGRGELLLWAIGLMLVFYLLKTFFLMYASWKQAIFNAALTERIQIRLFNGYLSQEYLFHLDRNSSSLLYNIQSEVNYLSHVVQALLTILSDSALILGVFAMLLVVNPELAIFTVLLFLLFGFLLNKLTNEKLKTLGTDRELHEKIMFKQVLQAFGGVKDVILFGKKSFFSNQFITHASERKRVFASQGLIQQIPRLYFELLSIFIIAAIVVYFVLTTEDLGMILPTIGLFMLAALRIMPSANKLASSFQTLRFTKPVINKLYEELQLIQNNLREQKDSKTGELTEKIEVRNLNFKYPNKNANTLKDINCVINKGETIGFLGASGSGKSTLIDLVLGILKPSSGGVFVDGKNISESIKSWQNMIGYVSQSIYLLDDSIRRNIAFGLEDGDIKDEKVLHALKMAHLEDYIASLPAGLDEIVGERGVKLSGGQRQRIGLARALYNNPPVLVLDEATSALDNITENEVMKAIRDLKGDKTILIIAHRTSTISHCDKIYAIEDGRISKEGNPLTFNIK